MTYQEIKDKPYFEKTGFKALLLHYYKELTKVCSEKGKIDSELNMCIVGAIFKQAAQDYEELISFQTRNDLNMFETIKNGMLMIYCEPDFVKTK